MRVALPVAALVALSACAAERVSDEQQILQLEDDWARALETRDGPLLDRIVAEDFTFIEPDGSVKDRAAYLADRQSDIADIESFEIADVEVDVRGSSALVSGVAHIAERRQGGRYRFSLRWKEMWIKDAGRWQVLAGQATPVNGRWDEPFLLGDEGG